LHYKTKIYSDRKDSFWLSSRHISYL
jgi:hypothetical protein